MAKLYKVRKKCMICGNIFYPKYAGSLYCEDCKNRKKEVVPKIALKVKAKPVKKAVKKTVKKATKKPVKKAAKKTIKKTSPKKKK
jgi:hypothetical protein